MSSNAAPAVYVASPLGFSEIGRHYLAHVLIPELQRLGYRVLDPWADDVHLDAQLADAELQSNEAARESAFAQVDRELGRRNARLIEESDVLMALLDGSDIDSGVAAEVGYAYALGRPIVGWRSDGRCAGENAGTRVNLQVAYFILESGGEITASLGEAWRLLGRLAPPSPRA
jgi:nucleoside 2-deoxyribosyltransferase